MKRALRLLLTLLTILCCSTVASATVEESQAGVVFEEAFDSGCKIDFWANFNAPNGTPTVRPSGGGN